VRYIPVAVHINLGGCGLGCAAGRRVGLSPLHWSYSCKAYLSSRLRAALARRKSY
jgi:Ran GTPase-activating protein (RanGAP) involved in mRNA processing and transport